MPLVSAQLNWGSLSGGGSEPSGWGGLTRPSAFQLTCLKRPLVVIHELFDKSIMDISW